MLGKPGSEGGLRINKPAPRLGRVPISERGPADRPRGSSVTFEAANKSSRRGPGQGLIGRLVQNEAAEQPLSVVDRIGTPRARTRAIFCGSVPVLSLPSAAFLGVFSSFLVR